MQIASLPEQKNAVAKVWIGNQPLAESIAEILQETETLKVEIDPQSNPLGGV